MQTQVKLLQILPLQTGTGKNGEWKKQDIIVETNDQYPKKICISIWGDKIGATNLELNNNYVIDFDIESREFNGKWYTDVKAWRISSADNNVPTNDNQKDGLPGKNVDETDDESEVDDGFPF